MDVDANGIHGYVGADVIGGYRYVDMDTTVGRVVQAQTCL